MEVLVAGAKAFAEDFYPGHPCQTEPCDECLDDVKRIATEISPALEGRGASAERKLAWTGFLDVLAKEIDETFH